MIDMTGEEVSRSIATEKNLTDLFFTKLESSPVVLESSIRELPLFPLISRRQSSSAAPETHTYEEGIALRKQKGCRCRQSKCLKLYCDCFASGVFCSDCDCAGCRNNSENYDVREAAMVNVLDRNPNAFNGKLSTCQIDKQYEAAPDTKLGLLQSRGCKCKRTRCLKKYCECFQANVMCSDKCKCINCKNVSEGFKPSVFPWGLNNRKLFDYPRNGMLLSNERNATVWDNNNNANDAYMDIAPGFYAHRERELPEWDSCPAPLSWKSDSPILNFLCCPLSSSPKLPYRKKRTMLGDTNALLPDSGDICALLLAASESATANADQNRIYIKPDYKEDNMCTGLWRNYESLNAEEEIPSCGRLIELIDAQYNGEEDFQYKTKINNDHETDIYMEQERAVLETFRDCLHKFMEIH